MTKLEKAIKVHAELAMRYNTTMAYNFSRTDLTRATLFKDGQPREVALVRHGDAWKAFALMPDETIAEPDYVIGLPVPETQKEWERVGLIQHRLHVRLHRAAVRVQQLASRTS